MTAIKPGEVYRLGEHRLLCGDSTDPDLVARFMGDRRASMCFTDPPWNVAIGDRSDKKKHRPDRLANDSMPPADFEALLLSFVRTWTPYLAGDLYCVLAHSEMPKLGLCLHEYGYHCSGLLIWVKPNFVIGRANYQQRMEPIWYGWHRDNRSSFNGSRKVDNVWEFDRPSRSKVHPTMKPVELVMRAVENSSRPGNTVVDPFAGAGSTLLACERLGRRCVTVELEPGYCQTVIDRWEEETGKKADRFTP